jgi:hypothetical protein
MPLIRLIERGSFDPETIKVMSSAFDKACLELGLVDRTDPLTELLARKIIEAAQTGERDPHRIQQRAMDNLGAARP